MVRPGGYVAIVDNITPAEPVPARRINAFERLRDNSRHFELTLSDRESFFISAGLTVEHWQQFRKPMDCRAYCDRMGVPPRSRTRLRVMLMQAPALHTTH